MVEGDGGGWAGWGTGIHEGTCCHGPWALQAGDEPLSSAPETSTARYIHEGRWKPNFIYLFTLKDLHLVI